MDHQWRAAPGPIPGNICPRCSTPHFPVCPPNPTPRFPLPHMQNRPPVYNMVVDPLNAPRSWERSPNNANYPGGAHLSQTVYGGIAIGTGSDYGVIDRSSKRLKMDETHLGSSMSLSNDNERRLKMIHEHGRGMNGPDYNTSSHETSASHLNHQAGHLYSESYGYPNSPHYNGRTNTPQESLSLKVYARPQTIQYPDQTTFGCGPVTHLNDTRLFKESRASTMEGYPVPGSYSASSNYANSQNGYLYPPTNVQHPLPESLPPPLDIAGQWTAQPKHFIDPVRASFPFPVDFRASTAANSLYPPVPEAHSLAPAYQQFSHTVHSSWSLFPKDSKGLQTAMSHHSRQAQHIFSEHKVSDKQNIIDVASLLKPPIRDGRPDHFVIILRGLPGSGKSYLARVIRDLEVEHGGKAPRIHSMDDYYMTEVDKVEENETSKSFVRGKKAVTKKVLEYCYEAEMEEAYRSSMLKAFKKTLDEGSFSIVIVDDRNLRVADFAQFWATAKRSGYEVYLLETSYKDPVGCTARNIHGFTRGDIEKMAGIWEEAPSLYFQLDARSLLRGDGLEESNIQEVDMDMDDEDLFRGLSKLEERKQEDVTAKASLDLEYDGSRDKKTWDAETDHDEEIKDISRSKWLGDLDEDNVEGGSGKVKRKLTALSGFCQANGKEGKSVCWGDQIPNTGFSICAMKKANTASLIIGPGPGYNLKSNPLAAEDADSSAKKNGDVKQKSVFQEHLRVERESFKAVFDRKRLRIGSLGLGLGLEDE